MKKLVKILTVGALLGSLTITAAGCSRAVANRASLASYWYYDSDYARIQPTFMGEENAEKFTYGVTFTPTGVGNYSVEYAEGVYKTVFYAKKLTVNDLHLFTDAQNTEWAAQYEQALGQNGGYMYYYATELEIPSVTYTFGGESKAAGEMRVTTQNYFLGVDSWLSPVYTERKVKSPEPVEYQPRSLDDCYYNVDREYRSYYDLSGGSVKTITRDNTAGTETEFAQSGINSDNSVFDRSYLDIAARAVKTKNSSQTVNIYTPSIPVRAYTLAGGTEPLYADAQQNDQTLSALQNILAAKGLFVPGEIKNEDGASSPKKLAVNSVSVRYNGGSFSGVSQTYWFAGLDDGKNTARTVMLKYTEPVVFNLGAFHYVLKSIDNMPV